MEGYPDIVGLFRDTADGERTPAIFNPRQIGDTRISSVQYIKFKLSPAQVGAWSRGAKIVIDDPHYQAERPLTQAELAELSHDFL